ncbi:MAG: hypothetical protein ACAH89_13165 [Rariglobus sp.]
MSPAIARADASRVVDPSQANTKLAPGADNTDDRHAPGNTDNQLPFKRNDRVQDNRFNTPELREKTLAPVNDRRAPFEMTETREKTIIDRKEFPKPEVKDRKISPDNNVMFSSQPKGDMVKKYDTVAKYQDRITDAETAASQRQPKLEKRTTFDRVNRFIFHRNGPGENDNPLSTKAGGGTTTSVSGGSQKTLTVPPPPVPPQKK